MQHVRALSLLLLGACSKHGADSAPPEAAGGTPSAPSAGSSERAPTPATIIRQQVVTKAPIDVPPPVPPPSIPLEQTPTNQP